LKGFVLPHKSKITEEKYNSMFVYYEEIKHLFNIEGMTNKIIQENTN
jgi:hemoglobin-like flavoprotein